MRQVIRRNVRGAAFKLLLAVIAVTGVLGGTAQARAQVVLDRQALETRVIDVRNALANPDTPGASDPTAQWNNWPNWNNWNNWVNWGNWGNWFNR